MQPPLRQGVLLRQCGNFPLVERLGVSRQLPKPSAQYLFANLRSVVTQESVHVHISHELPIQARFPEQVLGAIQKLNGVEQRFVDIPLAGPLPERCGPQVDIERWPAVSEWGHYAVPETIAEPLQILSGRVLEVDTEDIQFQPVFISVHILP
ncbi:hypothetical protein ALO52_200130 [Pseudomonas syringae pv. primulae]|uniref:Uncharacterized protein n=1 Tax=Pseudomonas syringae pv. primulae TaxID=251707 RepID=A0A0Q0CX94_9PSED|nr:hypothetical protein ALO52_200130 [Pseudomonas syringae pv. primulae]